MMKLYPGLLAVLGLLTSSMLLAEEWIGLDVEPPLIFGLSFSKTDKDTYTDNLYLSLPVSSAIGLDFDYSETTFIDDQVRFDSDSLLLGVDAEIESGAGFSLSYQFQGQREELEIEQYRFQLSFDLYPIDLRFGYGFGELRLFTRRDIRSSPVIPDYFQSDMNILDVGLDWWFDNLSFGLFHQRYDYEKRVSSLGSRPLLLFRVKPGVLAHSGLLLAEQTSLSIQSLYEHTGLAWNWSSSRSELDDSSVQSLQMDWTGYFGEHTGLIVSLGVTSEDEWMVGLGLEWIH